MRAVDGASALRRCLGEQHPAVSVTTVEGASTTLNVERFSRVVVVGAGKASAPMAVALEEAWENRVHAGVVCVKAGHGAPTQRVEILEGGHPEPDAGGLLAARRIASVVDCADAATLVVALVSGGASALLPLPAPGLTLEDLRATTRLLLHAGAEIRSMNTIRKHLSTLQGGWLATRAHPATVLTLVLSDVIDDPLDAIGSGPTVPDASTYSDARRALEDLNLWMRVPSAVCRHLERGIRGEVPETPDATDPAFRQCFYRVIGNNRMALEAAADEARRRGYRPLILTSSLQGEAREVGRVLASLLREVRHAARPQNPPTCLLAGGETTVRVRGPGRGGRNQELALSAAADLDGLPNVGLLSLGTDGTDGPTDAAGGWVCGTTLQRLRTLGLNPAHALSQNDTYPVLDRLGDLIRTGPTGTNVMDMVVMLAT